MTGLDIVVAALTKIGVVAAGETAQGVDASDGLEVLNELLDQWKAERLEIFQNLRTAFNLTANVQDYTVGTGGAANIDRPVFIDHVNYQDTSKSPILEYQMQPLTDDAWARIPIKSLTSPYPTSWYHNPTYPLATISFWPIQTVTTLQAVIYSRLALTEIAALSTTVTFPPAYRRMIVTNLAVDLCADYERTPNPALIKAADDSKAAVKRANKRLMDMSIDAAALGQGRSRQFVYNISTGP